MRRRQLLGGCAGLLVGSAVLGTVRGSEPFEPLGREDVPGTKEAVVDADGSTAYLATTDGFAVVDVTDPASPTEIAEDRDLLAEREDGPMGAVWDVTVSGDRLVVAGPATRGTGVKGFFLYDVSDPGGPERLAFHETSFPIHNAFFDGDAVYLTAGESIVIVDVSDDDPRQVGRWSPVDADDGWTDVAGVLRPPHDLWVWDDLAYVACWDAGTWIVDVSDPSTPEHVGRVGGHSHEQLAGLSSGEASREATEPPGNHHYVQVSTDGSLLAVGKESWSTPDGSGGPSGIDLWDVSDPADPRKRSEIPPPPTPDPTRGGTWTTSHNFDLVGDRLFSSWYQGGVKIHDVGDPASPEELAWWSRPDETAFWAAVLATEEFFVASSTNYPVGTATEGLYTFPNRAGEQAESPSLTGTRTATSGSATSPSTDPGGSTPTTDRPSDGSSPGGTKGTPGQPGFGIPTALAAVGTGVWWRSVQRSSGESDDRA